MHIFKDFDIVPSGTNDIQNDIRRTNEGHSLRISVVGYLHLAELVCLPKNL